MRKSVVRGKTKTKNMLSSNIRHFRKSLKLTQGEFSKLIGLSVTSISNYERGKSLPSASAMKKITEAMGDKSHVLFEER